MALSGLFTLMFGLAFFWDIHSLWYLVLVQVLGGVCQTTGWPGILIPSQAAQVVG